MRSAFANLGEPDRVNARNVNINDASSTGSRGTDSFPASSGSKSKRPTKEFYKPRGLASQRQGNSDRESPTSKWVYYVKKSLLSNQVIYNRNACFGCLHLLDKFFHWCNILQTHPLFLAEEVVVQGWSKATEEDPTKIHEKRKTAKVKIAARINLNYSSRSQIIKKFINWKIGTVSEAKKTKLFYYLFSIFNWFIFLLKKQKKKNELHL